jgi:hypothetical protein
MLWVFKALNTLWVAWYTTIFLLLFFQNIHLKMLICLCAPWLLGYWRNLISHNVKWFQCPEKAGAHGLVEPSAVQADFVSIVSWSRLTPQESLSADMAHCAKVYGCTKRWGAGALPGTATCQIYYTLHFWLFHPPGFQLQALCRFGFSSKPHVHCSEFSLQLLAYIFLDLCKIYSSV